MSSIEEHRKHFKTLETIRIPRILNVVAWMLGIGTTAVILFLAFAPWVQTTAGTGSVTALDPSDRLQDINALVDGRIEQWFVRDGSSVRGGDPIVKIVDNDPMLLERLKAKRNQIVAKRKAVISARDAVEVDLERTEGLYKKGLASRREFEQASIKAEQSRARVAEVEAELNRIDIEISRSSAQVVRAPRDGVVLTVNTGDAATLVKAGDVVATFIPDGAKRAVEIFIDGRDVALVSPGAKTRIQFEGWPAVQFSGWPSMAIGTFAGTVVSVDPSANTQGKFRVMLEEDEDAEHPWPEERFVRFGATARAWILLETVPVGFELWRQMNNFPPALPAESSAVPAGISGA
ncbi:MAG: HlyD family efflux transporter periplasmic adaptor subunit [Methyloceanibacter sp.]|nr:HlyD family efflux transporter periplasmic adaptor subunit [Methyloceanibacter sp.]